MSIKEVKIQRFNLRDGTVNDFEDEVALDDAVCIFLNDEFFRTLIATPLMKKELVVGHLLSEGTITSIDEILEVEVKPPKVSIVLKKDVDLELQSMSKMSLITTACGSSPAPLKTNQLGSLKVRSGIRVEADKIWSMMSELNRRSSIFRRTGGTHSAMLCSQDGGVLVFAEDVGRHNAVDKVVGAGALEGYEMGSCILLSSGRQSSDIVLKAARSGIPVIASVAGPLASGINVAEAAGITLICFVRGRRMNVYTHPQRVSIETEKSYCGGSC